jgi:hypothetical protein
MVWRSLVRNAKLFFLNCETNRDVFFVRLLVTSPRNICDLWRKTRNETPIYSMVSVALQLLFIAHFSGYVSSYRTPTVNHPMGRGAFRSVGWFFYAPWTSSTMFSRMFDKKSSTKTHIKYMSNYQSQIFLGVMNLPAYRDIPAYLASTWGPLGPLQRQDVWHGSGTNRSSERPRRALGVHLLSRSSTVRRGAWRGADKLEDSAELINIHWLIYPFNNR